MANMLWKRGRFGPQATVPLKGDFNFCCQSWCPYILTSKCASSSIASTNPSLSSITRLTRTRRKPGLPHQHSRNAECSERHVRKSNESSMLLVRSSLVTKLSREQRTLEGLESSLGFKLVMMATLSGVVKCQLKTEYVPSADSGRYTILKNVYRGLIELIWEGERNVKEHVYPALRTPTQSSSCQSMVGDEIELCIRQSTKRLGYYYVREPIGLWLGEDSKSEKVARLEGWV